jgi:tetratricopeptide (TPR) repeat protein
MGPIDREALRAIIDRGHSLWRARHFVESFQTFEEALRRAEETYGKAAIELIDPLVALTDLSLALSCRNEGLGRDPLEFGERALAIAASNLEPEDPRHGRIRQGLASAYLSRSAYNEALAHFGVALRSAELVGATEFRLGGILEGIVEALVHTGRYREAIPYAQRHAQLEEESAAHGSIAHIVAEYQLGRVFLGAKDYISAVCHIENALALCRARRRPFIRFEDEMLEMLAKARAGMSTDSGDR